MNRSEAQQAVEKMSRLKSDFRVELLSDWGDEADTWREGSWTLEELDRLYNVLNCLSDCLGGPEKLRDWTGGVSVRKADMGTHGGEALQHRVSFSTKRTFTAWTVVHEFAHTWDANYKWKLSRALERYTGGFTNPILSFGMRLARLSDSGIFNYEQKPGRQGRRPGCNRAGYFYGDKPSGSNWNFNRVEDFAESVAMYVGWERGNDLSDWARARLDRYLLEDGAQHNFFGVDNWKYYSRYFYPENGDYTKTRRWQFVDDLVKGRISI